MDIIVKPHHLRGNSFSHWNNPEKRRCPLQEAVNEQLGGRKYKVGSYGVYGLSSKTPHLGLIPDYWNYNFVTQIIKEANAGSEKEYILSINE